MKIKVTNENTNTLRENEIFVFGSNLAGIHGAGAALHAKNNFGAKQGIGEGLTGQCYALPTKDNNIKTLPINDIYKSIEKLVQVVKESNKFFIITAVGCGLAGYRAEDIAPMFEPFVHLKNVSLPQTFIDVIFPPKIMGFKVTDENMKCRDVQFTLNTKLSVKGDVVISENGFHFCKELKDCFNYYAFEPENRVFLVEGSGDYDFLSDKIAVRNIKFIRELSWYEVLDKVNSGNRNSGNRNSGDFNSGNFNSGNRNSGYSNSGNRNSGNFNSGNSNSGYSNSGNYNSGDYNIGDYNSGNFNSGIFNIDEPTLRMFGKSTEIKLSEFSIPYIHLPITEWIPDLEMTEQEKKENPKFYVSKGYLKTNDYKTAWSIAWEQSSETKKQEFLTLPNFDAKIFEEITGITV